MLLPLTHVHSFKGMLVTVTVVEPEIVVFCVDVARIDAAPEDTGVKRPELLTVPMLVGPTDHVTEVL